jgi:S1-C subfamily serine protease
VQVGGEGTALDAVAIAFDERNDIAVLRVDGLDAPPLPLAADPSSGDEGAVLGYPENGPYDVRAARLGSTETVASQDAYGRGPVNRSMTSFRGLVRSGNSGGPVVSEDGDVLTTVFAATTGSRQRGGYGVPNAVVRRIVGRAGGQVGTGPCAS